MPYFKITKPTSTHDRSYCESVERWWNWVFTPTCDTKQPHDVTFLRGDIIGDQRVLGAGILDTERSSIACYTRHVNIDKETIIFFPVFSSHFVENDPYGDGKPCGNIQRCLVAAKNDYGNLYDKWATFSVNGGRAQDIVNSLDAHYIETREFTVNVHRINRLNREAGFHLSQGEHKGVCVGIFLRMTDLQKGTYTFDFGGRATNYFGRAVYNIHRT